MEKPNFLESYKIHDKPEAIQAAERKEIRTKENGIVTDRSERIQAYLERLEEIFYHPDPEARDNRVNIFKEKFLYPAVLIKKENFPDSYFEYQKQQVRERGLGEVSFTDEQKREEIAKVMESQRLSLDAWLEYLTSADCQYPTDVKYFAAQGVLKLGNFDTSKYSFARRDKATTAPFAEIDREALSIVLGALEARHRGKDASNYSEELLALIDNKNSFGDMYAETMRDLDKKIDKESLLPITDGEWRVFKKGGNPQELVQSLSGKRSNLCIADIGSATRYLETGSVEVYFSHNRAKQPVMPRIAMAISDQGVYEVRGTYNKNEDVDPFISETNVLSQRLENITNGDKYAKQDACMKRMTDIYNKCFKVDRKTGEKTYLNPELTKKDLVFLYEIDQPIEGFGYQKDPRIAELRAQRNKEEDMLVTFDCSKEQIAHNVDEVNEDTKAYIGEWNPVIFQTIKQFPHIKHLYESFPENKIFMQTLETDPNINSPEKAEEAMIVRNIHLTDWGENILYKTEFSREDKTYELVQFTAEQLGFPNGATTDEIYAKAKELGLDLCPAEVGPHLRLKYEGKDWKLIAMKQITYRVGSPGVFSLSWGGGQLILHANYAKPDDGWGPNDEFIFSRPPSSR